MVKNLLNKHSSSRAFTLIELLVVIAIIAILAVVVILTLNPAALLQQGRDSNRVSDMSTLNSALTLYQTDQSGASSFSLGSSSVVYVSIPDPTATTTAGSNCSSLNLPTLPATYTYHCAGPNYYRNINGQGWIPINLASTTTGTPLSNLPVDPTNQSSSKLYYTYTTNGSQFELTALMESAKYQIGGSNDEISGDGGPLASVYAKGTNLTLEPLDYGDPTLVGYWSLNEGTGSTSGVTKAYDWSGNGNNGTWYGTAIGTNGYYSPGNLQNWAGAFDGTSTYVSANATALPIGSNPRTYAAWFNLATLPPSGGNMIFHQGPNGGVNNFRVYVQSLSSSLGTCSSNSYTVDGSGNVGAVVANFTPSLGTWHYLVEVLPAGQTNFNSVLLYLDGNLLTNCYTSSQTVNTNATSGLAIGEIPGGYDKFNGLLDDLRIYNRALSAAQVAAMYNGGK
jgi:prepilin-type N-terminal cleavage/methylation domain-containing protein